MFDYLKTELDVPIYRKPILRQIDGKTFFIGHGDGLGPGDYGYKRLKKFFANPFCQWAFARLHPNFGIWLAQYFSGSSRAANVGEDQFLGPDKEWLLAYAERKLQQQPDIDYFVFGHRHLPIDYTLTNGHSRYINLGEWVNFNSYAVFANGELQLQFFENPAGQVIRGSSGQ
ncbi:MAG: hypothetical protein D6772_08760 [Bacteroidetes bacterium]|nr:MAG: hypothetical protein D6772_08760 [Bacteroidota bacterium]